MTDSTQAMDASILLIECDPHLADQCRQALDSCPAQWLSANLEQALELIDQSPWRLAIVAARSDDANVARALQRWPAMPVLWVQADSDATVPEPVALRGLLRQLRCAELASTLAGLLVPGPVEPIACCQGSRQLLSLARRVASADATVLICGESGTGKEVLARYIHRHSSRGHGPWVAINCAAIPDSLMEAELFGHVRGAFSGAVANREGLLEAANGGTLLLDEISEMPTALQAKLLRVLQESEVARLGSNAVKKLDIRIIATSNRNLVEEVSAGRFREDLYYRLTVLPLHIKPLRRRRDDLLPLALQILVQHTEEQPRRRLSDSAMDLLCAHHWPGNVRELSNTLARALVYCGDSVLGGQTIQQALHPLPSHDTGADTAARTGAGVDLDQIRRRAESRCILQALRAGHGSRREAAEQLGISQRTLRYKLAKMKEQGIAIPG